MIEGNVYFNLNKTNIRNNFIKKVFSIILIQLLITFLFFLMAYQINKNDEAFVTFYRNHYYLSIIAIIIELVCLYTLACFIKIARRVPINYILLFTFTICFSYPLSIFVVTSKIEYVTISGLLTLAITLGLIIYAFKTKTDMTICGGLLFGMGVGLFCASILLYFIREHFLYIIFLYFGLALYCIYLVYDVQLLLDRKQNHLSVDDYIFAALNIYIDIVQIFIYLLRILQASD